MRQSGTNPSIQCSVCGQWKRYEGIDKDGSALYRFFNLCADTNGEYEHIEDVCNNCCETNCPYRKSNG